MNTRNVYTAPYSSTNTGESSDIRQEILTNELGNQMLDMVAPIYDRSKVALHLFQTIGITLEPELDFIWGDFIAQIFPQTATWGLDNWEEQYGIVTDKSKTIEQRRSHFMSMKFYRPPMTPKRLKDFAEEITGFQCELTENVAPNTFHLLIHGYPQNIKSVIEMLNKKSPAHLFYTIKGIETETIINDTFPVFAGSPKIHETLLGIELEDYTKTETLSSVSDTFQVMAGSPKIHEKLLNIELEDYTQTETLNTTFYIYPIIVGAGNMAEDMGEIEVMN